MLDATIRDWIFALTHSDLRIARYILRCYIELVAAKPGAEQQRKAAIDETLNLCKRALEQLRSGAGYNQNDHNDPVQKALDSIDQYDLSATLKDNRSRRRSSAEQALPYDRGRIASLVAATNTLKQTADVGNPSIEKLPIRVAVYTPDPNSLGFLTSTENYVSLREAHYTIDDLLFSIRLNDPASLTNHPYIYSRLFNAHAHTQGGSKFEQITGSKALTALPRIGSTATVAVHLVSMTSSFVLLIRGVPIPEPGEDEFHVIRGMDIPITATLRDDQQQTRTFHHHSEAWTYRYGPDHASDITWSYLRKIGRLKMYQSDWIVCVGGG
ncbi:hypothetical protein FRC01_010053 [Tulasnella sp. 417]|nr:hypothetical protein FRC01_010053 [Tulasnella sp. 417]